MYFILAYIKWHVYSYVDLDLRLQVWNILPLFELHIAGKCLDPDNPTESEYKEKIWDFSIAHSIFIIQS